MKWRKMLSKAANWVGRLFYWGVAIGASLFWFFGVVTLWYGGKLMAEKLLLQSMFCMIVLVFLEVRNLKQWGADNLAALVETADVAAKQVDKLKAQGWNVKFNGEKL